MKVCPQCGSRFSSTRSSQKYCTPACRYRFRDDQTQRREYDQARHRHRYRADPDAHNVRNGAPQTKAAFYGVDCEPIDREAVFDRDRWTCGICHRKVSKTRAYPDPLCATIDHVIPWAQGGSHTLDNVQCAHLVCNERKGDRLAPPPRPSPHVHVTSRSPLMHDRGVIRDLHTQGIAIRAIARDLGIDRNTVRRAIDPTRPLTYHRRSRLDDVEQEIRDVLVQWPHMPATGVARRLGWSGGMTQFSRRVHVLRREVLYGAS